jgi:hypothetical protein
MTTHIHLEEDSSKQVPAIGETHVTYIPRLTVKKLVKKLKEIEADKKWGYEIALLGVESIDYTKICHLHPIGHADNDPNLMPSRFMILKDASDKMLKAAGSLDKFPYDLHKDASETMSVRSLRRHLILAGFLNEELDDPKDTATEYELDDSLYDAACSHLDWAAVAVEGELEGGTHTVEEGEGLSDIAGAYGLREWRLLYALNKDVLGDEVCDIVYPGTVLKLPDATDNPLVDWFNEMGWSDYLDPDLGYEYPGKYLSLTFTQVTKGKGEPLVFKDEKGNKVSRKCQIYTTAPIPQLLHDIVLEAGDDLDVMIPDTQNIGLWIDGEGIAFNGTTWPTFAGFLENGIPSCSGNSVLVEPIDLQWTEIVESESEDKESNGPDKKEMPSMTELGHDGMQTGRNAQSLTATTMEQAGNLQTTAQKTETAGADALAKAQDLLKSSPSSTASKTPHLPPLF